jgi:hypothetical protein
MSRLLCALLLGSGCRRMSLEATVSEEIVTVVTARWTTPEPMDSHIEFGTTEALGRRSKTSGGTEHEAVLIGLRAEETVYLQAVAGSDRSAMITVTTGTLPAELPQLTVTGDPDALPGYLAMPLMGTAGMVVIVDGAGEILWYTPLATRDLSYRMWLDRTADTVTYNRFEMSGDSSILRQPLDGGEPAVIPFSAHHHDFLPLPDGGLAAIGTIEQDVEGEAVAGEGIFEVDDDGQGEVLWSIWDDLTYIDPGDALGGWGHANALDYIPEEDAFYLSLRSLDAILKITASTGELQWILSGDETISDFSFAPGSTPTSHQHQLQVLAPDRLLVFDNRYDLQEPARVVELALDLEEGVAEEVWSYQHEPTLSVYALGDVARLEDGSTLIDWSTSGVIQYLSADGEELWRLGSELGYAFGYVSLLADLDE